MITFYVLWFIYNNWYILVVLWQGTGKTIAYVQGFLILQLPASVILTTNINLDAKRKKEPGRLFIFRPVLCRSWVLASCQKHCNTSSADQYPTLMGTGLVFVSTWRNRVFTASHTCPLKKALALIIRN